MWYNGSMTKELQKLFQVGFRKAKAEDIPLNGKQLDLLALLSDAGPDGAVVYGKGPSTTVDALEARGLVCVHCLAMVVVMGKLEERKVWCVTEKGKASLGS